MTGEMIRGITLKFVTYLPPRFPERPRKSRVSRQSHHTIVSPWKDEKAVAIHIPSIQRDERIVPGPPPLLCICFRE